MVTFRTSVLWDNHKNSYLTKNVEKGIDFLNVQILQTI